MTKEKRKQQRREARVRREEMRRPLLGHPCVLTRQGKGVVRAKFSGSPEWGVGSLRFGGLAPEGEAALRELDVFDLVLEFPDERYRRMFYDCTLEIPPAASELRDRVLAVKWAGTKVFFEGGGK